MSKKIPGKSVLYVYQWNRMGEAELNQFIGMWVNADKAWDELGQKLDRMLLEAIREELDYALLDNVLLVHSFFAGVPLRELQQLKRILN